MLHVRYTARDGGTGLKAKALASLRQTLENAAATDALVRIFSVRRDFATEWARLTAVGGQPQSIVIDMQRFPYFLSAETLAIWKVGILVRHSDTTAPAGPTAAMPPGESQAERCAAYVQDALALHPTSRADIRRALGRPDTVIVETEPNRHIFEAIDSLFTIEYSGVTFRLRRAGAALHQEIARRFAENCHGGSGVAEAVVPVTLQDPFVGRRNRPQFSGQHQEGNAELLGRDCRDSHGDGAVTGECQLLVDALLSGLPLQRVLFPALILNPVLMTEGVIGAVQVFEAAVFGGDQQPLAGQSVSLTSVSATGALQTLNAIAGAGGKALFTVTVGTRETEFQAQSGNVGSNAVHVTPVLSPR